ncbi:MAG: IS66 family transposase [Gammaproteobacteria bacterium]|nr:IS66 family transposase [Gammaproteobacteria bacterium]
MPDHIQKELEELRAENAMLRQKLDALLRKVFGTSSEKVDLDQLLLFEEQPVKKPEGDAQKQEGKQASPSKKPRKKRTPREATLPSNIEVEETILLPDEVKENPQDFSQIDEEVTTKLDYSPAKFIKVVIRRLKFVRRNVQEPNSNEEEQDFCIAPLPPSLKERSLLTPNLAAEIATNRFCDHLPYYRQEQHFLMRHKVHLPRSTMSQWMRDLASDYLVGIYEAMHQQMLEERYLQADETPIDYLDPGHGSTKKGYLWTLSQPNRNSSDGRGDIFYQWHLGRSANCLRQLLESESLKFTGVLQCDGYKAYNSYQRGRQEDLKLIGCWAHVRRKFVEAKSNKPKLTGWILKQIENLYHIESQLRKSVASSSERERVRLWQSLPIYNRLQKALWKLKSKANILPKSPLGKAINYALSEWGKLKPCFLDGLLEVDNNLIENGIRPTKLGAKNWLFMGSDSAGQTNAIWYSLIESIRRRQLNPRDYFVWLFEELPKIKVTKGTFAQYTPKTFAEKMKQQSRLKKAS